ncbi:ferrous iron transporter B, partial [Bacillus paranthracis]|nr:ferrous iron transporter B [Bacillus paranthracis]
GCNAAALMSTRILESPRERMLAILTNNFVPCNGRCPMLILMASLFIAAGSTCSMQTLFSAGAVVGVVVIGTVITLTVSWLLSETAL